MLQIHRPQLVFLPGQGNAPVHLFDQRCQQHSRLLSLRLIRRPLQNSCNTPAGTLHSQSGLCAKASAAASNSRSGAPGNSSNQSVSKKSKHCDEDNNSHCCGVQKQDPLCQACCAFSQPVRFWCADFSAATGASVSSRTGTGVFILLLLNLVIFVLDHKLNLPQIHKLYLDHIAPKWCVAIQLHSVG